MKPARPFTVFVTIAYECFIFIIAQRPPPPFILSKVMAQKTEELKQKTGLHYKEHHAALRHMQTEKSRVVSMQKKLNETSEKGEKSVTAEKDSKIGPCLHIID